VAIAFIAGTTAEVIKLAPLMHALRDEGRPYELWNTAQHVGALRSVLDDLGLPQPDEHLVPVARQTPLVRSSQVPLWAARVLGHGVRHAPRLRRRLRAGGTRPLVVVHGDTFTTVLGSVIGRLLGAEVAHVEAGMRSGNVWHPMPEELNRRLVARIARVHYAPTLHEVDNLRAERARGELVETGANTVIDALRRGIETAAPDDDEELPETFGLVTLHRFELLRNDAVLTSTLRTLAEESRRVPLLMMAGDTERARIDALGLRDLFDDGFRLLDKRAYARFLPVLVRASFVVTDSGGLQQECGILGMPCAVHREATESLQGVGENLLLTRLDMEVLRRFVREWPAYRRPSQLDTFHPTRAILDHLGSRGLLPGPVGTGAAGP
jgi:UDP-N-acetylglucosamine 2-epimerase (non-hydrolysing)